MADIIRHGDVFLVRRDTAVDPKRARRDEERVLARGEATGHAHVVTLGDVWVEDDGTFIVEVSKGETGRIEQYIHGRPAQVETEEDYRKLDIHRPLDIPPGTWTYVPQREYTPEGWVRVAD